MVKLIIMKASNVDFDIVYLCQCYKQIQHIKMKVSELNPGYYSLHGCNRLENLIMHIGMSYKSE